MEKWMLKNVLKHKSYLDRQIKIMARLILLQLILSAKKSKSERMNKQATLTHKHYNTAVKWKVKE